MNAARRKSERAWRVGLPLLLAVAVAVALLLSYSVEAWARPGAGHSYSGGSSRSSRSGGGHGGGDGDAAGLIFQLVLLCIRYPALGVPLVIILVVFFVAKAALSAGQRGWSTV